MPSIPLMLYLGLAMSLLPEASPGSGFVPVRWGADLAEPGEISRSLSPSAEKLKGREETNFSHGATSSGTQDGGWRACSKGTFGCVDGLPVNHTAPGLAAHNWLAWHRVSGAARTADPGSERQMCRECQIITLCCPCPSLLRWGNWGSERAVTHPADMKLVAAQVPEQHSSDYFLWMNFLRWLPLVPFLWGQSVLQPQLVFSLTPKTAIMCQRGALFRRPPLALRRPGWIECWAEAWGVPLPEKPQHRCNEVGLYREGALPWWSLLSCL